MADVEKIADDVRKQKLSTLNAGISKDDIINVWKYVSDYIQKQMLQTRGVNISGLGLFSFSQKKLDVGNNKFILMQRPVFILSERFAQQHQLSCTKYFVTGQIPVRDLNYAAISTEGPFSRDTIEACVKEVLQEFSRALAQGRNVEFSLCGLGRLSIRGGKVKMKFFKEFVNSLDDSGQLVDALQDRPDTADSVMSHCTTRAQTSNTMILPSITENNSKASKKPKIETIQEDVSREPVAEDIDPFLMEAEAKEREYKNQQLQNIDSAKALVPDSELQDVLNTLDDQMKQKMSNLKQGPKFSEGDMNFTSESNRNQTEAEMEAEEALKAAGLPETLLDDNNNRKDEVAPLAGRVRQLAPMAQAGAVSLDDMVANAHRMTPVQGSPYPGQRVGYTSPLDRQGLHSPIAGAGLSLPTSPKVYQERAVSRPLSQPMPPASACGHNAGQELCYLCHQRSAKNIPVSFDEERRLREMEEDKLLSQYNLMKNNEAILSEQEREKARRFENQKVSAFNLGVAEAVKEKSRERPDPSNAYIFKRRPLTPPRQVKYNQLAGYLSQQLNDKTGMENKEKTEKEFLERLEQVQLAEDLASQRERYIQEKAEERNRYKNALSTQLKYKPLPIPGLLPDTEVFGKNDTTMNDIMERKRHAQFVAREQLNTVADKKRAEILKRMQEQKEEEDTLRKNREGLLSDRARRYERTVRNRKSLESDWLQSAEQKKTKELEDRLRTITPGGLLHEQCDRYRRCAQCKKKLANIGESNVWRESRYIPGARVMV